MIRNATAADAAALSAIYNRYVALHEKLGFRKVGQFDEVGFKLGRWVDVGYWQAML